MEKADLEKVLEWRNSDRIRAVMFTDRLITMDEHRAWYEGIKNDENTLCFIFEVQGSPAGVVNVVGIDRRNGRCSWGFYLGEAGAPRGTGTAMGLLALEYVFEVLGLRKLCGEVLASNTKSIEFHKKLGFVEEGRFIKHVLKDGKYEDVVAMALFNEDWVRIKQRLKNLLCCNGAKR
ncbi:MAG: UDP-4-amino-4,6-dideoxy-N-acetyl-beta-L-altrosamine N-acetyltransferase [Bacillota bacterium]